MRIAYFLSYNLVPIKIDQVINKIHYVLFTVRLVLQKANISG